MEMKHAKEYFIGDLHSGVADGEATGEEQVYPEVNVQHVQQVVPRVAPPRVEGKAATDPTPLPGGEMWHILGSCLSYSKGFFFNLSAYLGGISALDASKYDFLGVLQDVVHPPLKRC